MDEFPFKSFVQPLGIKGAPLHKSISPQSTPKTILVKYYFLAVSIPKGIDMLLEAISLLDDPSLITLSIVGPSGSARYKEYLLSLVARLKLSTRVHWFDPVYGADKGNFIQDLTCLFCQPEERILA